MAFKNELTAYQDTLRDTVTNLATLSAKLRDMSSAIGTADSVVSGIDTAGDLAEKARKSIDDQLTVLKVTKLAGPLKAPSKIFEKVLKSVKPVAEKIEKAVDKLNNLQNSSKAGTEEEGEFLDDLSDALSNAKRAIDTTAEALETQAIKLATSAAAMTEFMQAYDTGLDAVHDDLFDRVEDQIAARNAVAGPLANTFNAIVSKLNGVLEIISSANMSAIQVEMGDLEKVDDIFGAIAGPMATVASVLKPVEPILNAVGFLVDLVLGPIFDFLTKSLGIDAVLEKISDQIKSIFPNADFLDPLLTAVKDLLPDMEEFNLNKFGITAFQQEIEAKLFAGTVGNALLGPTGIGTNDADTITGSNLDNLIDARRGDDVINAGGGNDVIVAGAGDDVINGGAGTDTAVFSGFFQEYELARDANGNIRVTHLKPDGIESEGTETLIDVEHIVFQNIRFTKQGLDNALFVSSGSKLPTDNSELIFLNSNGTPNGDGQHVVNARGGDDRVFGSSADDEINGDAGNDLLLGMLGNDEINGGSGSDTFQILDDGKNIRNTVDLKDGFSFGQDGQDTFTSIENLIIGNSYNDIVTGNDAANNILTAGGASDGSGSGGRDLLTGLGGDDVLISGDSKDVLIGGAGRDRMLSGNGNDYLISGSRVNSGQGETHDGGEGLDTMSYSRNYNYVRDFAGTDDPSFGNAIRTGLTETADGSDAVGRLRIFAQTGKVQHIDADGKTLATDTILNVESFVGSDQNDIIYGGFGNYNDPVWINGADGNDTIYTNGANRVSGGDGDDYVRVTKSETGGRSGNNILDGGAGYDILDLSALGGFDWDIDWIGSISRSTRGASEGKASFFGNASNFEEVRLGHGKHDVRIGEPGSVSRMYKAGDSDDRFYIDDGRSDFLGGGGNDHITMRGEGGKAFGQGGDDTIIAYQAGDGHVVNGGGGNDFLQLRRTEGVVNGGSGYDKVLLNPFEGWGVVDLAAGTVKVFYNTNFGPRTDVDSTINGVEEVIGTEEGDTLNGSSGDNTFVGREGNDVLNGLNGRDQLFGGAGNDTLDGGAGNDKLHGGLGNDVLRGGAGKDTADFSIAAPDGLEGQLEARAAAVATTVDGVDVDLGLGTADGIFGSNTLQDIENVYGSNKNDKLKGDGSGNTLSGGLGSDLLQGEGGNDVLITGEGNDTAEGGNGKDTIIVGDGNATVDGGSGADRLELGMSSGKVTLDFASGTWSGNVNVITPAWADTGTQEQRVFGTQVLTPELVRQANVLFADSPDDLTRLLPQEGSADFARFVLSGKSEQRAITGSFQNVEVVAGVSAGQINIRLSNAVESYDGQATKSDILDFSGLGKAAFFNLGTMSGNVSEVNGDTLTGIDGLRGGSGDDTMNGSSGDNMIFGAGGRDRLFGREGQDRIDGGQGKDLLKGGSGRDTINGGSDDDSIEGGDGYDRVNGGGGDDTIKGENGQDTVLGGNGDDDIQGGLHNDRLFGQSGRDTLNGGQGADSLYGGDQNDKLVGAWGNDELQGGNGNDQLFGGSGNDLMFGGQGADKLTGGTGKDTMKGGDGNDTFIFANGFGQDTIRDFDALNGAEKIDLRSVSSITSFSDLVNNHLSQPGSNTIINAGGGNTITLENVARSDLSLDDFIF